MAKPKTSDRSNQFMEYVKYTWEFLRRNKKYVSQWNALYDDPTPKHDVRNVHEGASTEKEEIFCSHWGIGLPLSPEISYDALLNDSDVDPYFMFPMLMIEFNEEPILIKTGSHYGTNFDTDLKLEIAETGRLILEIDLSYPKGVLLEKFEALLGEWDGICKSTMGGESSSAGKKRLKKFNSTDFDTYLKVHDLKKKMSWAKLAEELNLNNVQTARNHYNSALKLINHGISLYVE